jgi:EF-hand domain pair
MSKTLMFTNSEAFKHLCSGVFKSVDTNKDNHVNKDELLVAMCKMHFKLAKLSLGVSEPPNAEELEAKMVQYDTDASGGLTPDEFHRFCKEWFADKGVFFLKSLLISSFMAMVALPNMASALHKETMPKSFPKAVFKVLFGVVFKLVSTRLPGLLEAVQKVAS